MSELSKEECDWQVLKAISYIKRGGNFNFWLRSKDFYDLDRVYISNQVYKRLGGSKLAKKLNNA